MRYWPFALRSTVDSLRTELFCERQHRKEVERLLAQTQIELHNHKMVLAGRGGVIKRMVEAS